MFLFTALSAGCAVPVGFQNMQQRAAALDAFRAGQAQLVCPAGQVCMVNWAAAHDSANRLMQAQRWEDLADVVLASGYDQDLTWFYLGLAASGLGYNDAARTYLARSEQRSIIGGLQSCLPNVCDGINLPQDADSLMASLPPDEPVPRRVVQRRRPAARTAARQAAPQGSASSTAGWVQPVGNPD